MKKKLLLITFITLWAWFGSGCEQKTQEEIVADSLSLSKASQSQDSTPILIFEREFGECLGNCPVYKILVFKDGKTVFEGIKNVRQKGTFSSVLSNEELKLLFKKFDETEFFSLKDKYVRNENCSDPVLSDADYVKTTFIKEGLSKTVTHYQGCMETVNKNQAINNDLKKLFELQEFIINQTKTNQWIK